jgi:hypothetical protein
MKYVNQTNREEVDIMKNNPDNFRPKEDFRFMGAWLHKYEPPSRLGSYRDHKRPYKWVFVCQILAVIVGYLFGKFFIFS